MLNIIEIFLTTWALCRFFQLEATNVIGIIFAILSCLLIKSTKASLSTDNNPFNSKIAKLLLWGLAGLYTLFTICGNITVILYDLDHILFQLIIIIVSIVGFCFLYYRLCIFLCVSLNEFSNNHNFFRPDDDKNLPIFRFSFLLNIIAWIPYLLKNFPGVMTIDSINQYAQVIGAWEQSNHHPWWHTQVIRLCYNIGLLITKDPSLSIAFYTIFQMILMSVIIAYAVSSLYKTAGLSRIASLIITVVFAFLPYNATYAVTVWKDAAFAAGVLLYCTCIYRYLYDKMNPIIFTISCIMLALFRNNGWYVFLLMFGVILITLKKKSIRISIPMLISLIIILIMKGPLLNHFGVVESEVTESLSIPLQQMSRVVYDNEIITSDEEAYLDSIIGINDIHSRYQPYVSDNIKKLAKNKNLLQQDMTSFFKMYIKLGLHHPAAYVRAYIDQTYGYWYPETTSIATGNEYIIANEFGVSSHPLIKGPFVTKVHEINMKLKNLLPIYGWAWCMGASLWAMLFACLYLVIYKRSQEALSILPGIFLVLSLLIATPVAEEFRYGFCYIFCLPFYAGIIITPRK